MEIEPLQLLNRYKEVVHEKVEYDALKVILDRIKTLGDARNQLIQKLYYV